MLCTELVSLVVQQSMSAAKCGLTLCGESACRSVLLDLTSLPLCSAHFEKFGELPGVKALDFLLLSKLKEAITQPTTQREARKSAVDLESAAEMLEVQGLLEEAAIKWSQALQLRRRLTTEKARARTAARLGYLLFVLLELPEEALQALRLSWTLEKSLDQTSEETAIAGLLLAHCLLDLYCEQEAITVLREQLESHPTHLSSQNLLAWILSLRGSDQEAESVLYASLESAASEAEVAEACLYLSWVKTSAEYLSKAAELFAELPEAECRSFLLALKAVLLRNGVHVFGDIGEIASKVATLECPLAGQLVEVMQALIGGTAARETLRIRVEQERAKGPSMVLAGRLQLYAMVHREETDKRLFLLEEALKLYGDSERVAPFRYAAALEEHYKAWPKGDVYLSSFLHKHRSRNPCSEPAMRAYQVLSRLRILRHDRAAALELARDTAQLVGQDWFAMQALAAHCLLHLPLQKMGAELCRELIQTEDRELSASVQMRLGGCCLRNGQVEEAERLITQALTVFSEPSLQRAQCTKLLAVCAQKLQQFPLAEQLYEAALSLYRDIHIGASFTLHTVAVLADLCRKQKEPARGLAIAQTHVALVRSTYPLSLCLAEALQLSLRHSSDPVELLLGYEEILKLQQSADSCVAAARALVRLCEDKFPTKLQWACQKCLDVLRAIHPGSWEIKELLWKQAAGLGTEAFDRHLQHSEGIWQVQACIYQGEWMMEHSNLAAARPNYTAALDLLKSLQDPPASLLEDLASFWQLAGEQSTAVDLYIEAAVQAGEASQVQRAYRNAAAALKSLRREADAEVLSEAAAPELYS